MNFFYRLEHKIFAYHNNSYLLYLPRYNSLYRISPIIKDILLDAGKSLSQTAIIADLSARYLKKDIMDAMNELKTTVKKESLLYPVSAAPGLYRKDSIKKLELHISNDCNMRCSYCFARGGDYGLDGIPGNMSWHIARRTIDWFFGMNKGKKGDLFIHFFGGEPLTNTRLLRKIFGYVRKKTGSGGIPAVHFSIATNGTLLTEEAIKLLAGNNCMPWVSLDASKKSHDSRRVYKDGSNSYEDVISGIKRLKAIAPQLPVVLSVTLDRHDSLANVIKLQKKLGIEMMEFRFEFSLYRKDGCPDKDFYGRLKKIKKEMDYLYKSQFKYGKFFNILDHSSFYYLHTKRRSFFGCGAGKNRVAVVSDGSIYICSPGIRSSGMKIGHVLSGIKAGSAEKIEKLYKEHLKIDADCGKCWARKLCARCVLSGVKVSTAEGENRSCDYRRFISEYVLKSYFSLNKDSAGRMFVKDKKTEKFIEEINLIYDAKNLMTSRFKRINSIP